MFEAKVYTVSILSSGIILEEEHIAREIIARWNVEEGEKRGMAFLVVPNNCMGVTSDIFIFAIDNYVNDQRVEEAISKGAKVILFFRSHHDEKNTLESEVEKTKAFRERIQDKCVCMDYGNKSTFEETLFVELSMLK